MLSISVQVSTYMISGDNNASIISKFDILVNWKSIVQLLKLRKVVLGVQYVVKFLLFFVRFVAILEFAPEP